MPDKIPNLVELESKVKRTTVRKHQKEISLMAELLNVYTNGFNLIHSFQRTGDNDVQFVWLLMIVRSLHSMRSAILLMLSGYYGPALALLRTVTEDWLIGRDCEHYQPTLDTILYEKHRFGDKKLKLRYIDMAQRVGLKDNVKDIVYKSDYRFQSKFTHAGRLSLAIMKNQKTNELIVAPAYDKLLFYACCELLMRNGLRVNELMYALLNSFSGGSVETWHTMVEPAVAGIVDWLKTLQQQYGGKDIDVGEVIK
ncbi:MAG: hypothetical protein KAW83_03750 [Dehalococcoidia bacterium]|nr:hypothetical protein [Dehalococcoidia bacterium]